MDQLNLILICLAALLLIAVGLASFSSPYARATHLFTKAETNFYHQLVRAAGDQYVVFGKVRVADLVQVKGASSKRRHMQALGRIAQKHVDFCLCNPHDLSVVCVLELNDKSHQRKDRIQRDDFIDKLFKKVKLPIVWVPAARSYDPQVLRQKIAQAIYEATAPTT